MQGSKTTRSLQHTRRKPLSGTDQNTAAQLCLPPGHVRHRLAPQPRLRSHCNFHQGLAPRGQPAALNASLNQWFTQGRFQLGQATRHRRRRDIQQLPGLKKTATPRDGQQQTKVVPVCLQRHTSHPPWFAYMQSHYAAVAVFQTRSQRYIYRPSKRLEWNV